MEGKGKGRIFNASRIERYEDPLKWGKVRRCDSQNKAKVVQETYISDRTLLHLTSQPYNQTHTQTPNPKPFLLLLNNYLFSHSFRKNISFPLYFVFM